MATKRLCLSTMSGSGPVRTCSTSVCAAAQQSAHARAGKNRSSRLECTILAFDHRSEQMLDKVGAGAEVDFIPKEA